MSNYLLQGKKGIIFGALDDMSIAWKVAERAHEEGAEIILTNAPVALRMGKIADLGEKLGAEVVPAEATNMDALNALLDRAEAQFGKIDFVLHSIGMSLNVRKKRVYTDLNYDWLANSARSASSPFPSRPHPPRPAAASKTSIRC